MIASYFYFGFTITLIQNARCFSFFLDETKRYEETR